MFTEKELELLYHLYRGDSNVDSLSGSLGISKPETYRLVREMRRKDVLDPDDLCISRCAFAKRLMFIMSEGTGMSRFLRDRRLDVLLSITEPRTIDSISYDTGISESYLRKILSIQIQGGMVQNINGVYRINDDEYPEVRPFLESYKDHREMSDPRVPRMAKIIRSNDREILYSSREETDDELTAFSVFEGYGVKGMNYDTRYYVKGREGSSIDDVFNDALAVAEKENDWRLRMVSELFFMKNQGKFAPSVRFLITHNRVMAGEHVKGWPSKQDIDDRMWMISTTSKKSIH